MILQTRFNYFLAPMICGVLISCGPSQKARVTAQYTAEQIETNVTIEDVFFNKDESHILMSSNASGIFNVYELGLSDTLKTPLTTSVKESFYGNGYLPGSTKFIYTANSGGNEMNHLFVSRQGDSEGKDITPWMGSRNTLFGWSTDKKQLYIKSNKRDPKHFDMWKMDTATWEPSLLFENDSMVELTAMSSKERYLALFKAVSTDKNELYLYDRTNKTTQRLSSDQEAVWNAMGFEKDESRFYYTTNEGAEFTYLMQYDIASGEKRKLFETNWDVTNFQLSENNKYHLITLNEDGKNKVLLFDHASNSAIPFPEIPGGDIQQVVISDSEKNFLITAGSGTSTANLYVYNTDNKQLKQLTNTLNKLVRREDLVAGEVIRFKSFDGREIPAIYYKPFQADKNNKVPAVLSIHGGPGGQSRIGYHSYIQFLVNHGYAVLAVNNRGSTGYGKTFYKLDNKEHGNGDLLDCIWAKKWLSTQVDVDSTAIGILGGSYGGNMVLNALCLHPDEFKVGVDLFGVTNWLRTLRSIPPYWESFRAALYEEMGDPNTNDSMLLKKASPLFNYEKIKKPLLVFQGTNDVRVLKIESDEIVAGVKKNNVPVEYVVFPDEGHGFVKKENIISTDIRTLGFLDHYLKSKVH
jgi:dipeptidyl aminopeptidase/acylaminoacyl peptidase